MQKLCNILFESRIRKCVLGLPIQVLRTPTPKCVDSGFDIH